MSDSTVTWETIADHLPYRISDPDGHCEDVAGGPRCPLPVVRFDHSAADAWEERYAAVFAGAEPGNLAEIRALDPEPEHVAAIEVCGEPVSLVRITGETLMGAGGGLGYEVPTWRLECRAGHRLLVPDVEDAEVEPTPDLVVAALTLLSPNDRADKTPTLGGRIPGTGAWTVDDLHPPDGVHVVTLSNPPRPALRDPHGGSWASWMALPDLDSLREQLRAGEAFLSGYRARVLDGSDG